MEMGGGVARERLRKTFGLLVAVIAFLTAGTILFVALRAG